MKPTPLTAEHRAAGAKLIDFAGWEMPVQFESLIQEHLAVRTSVGIFDLTHMGEFLLRGPGATKALSKLTTNDPSELQPGMIQYSLLTNEQGGIIDDILVYCLTDGYGLVVNASNQQKDYQWISTHLEPDCELVDISDQIALIAVQGQNSQPLTEEVFGESFESLKYYSFTTVDYQGQKLLISRTGYTGEDGFEIYLPNELAVDLWRKLKSAGAPYGVQQVGLGARDTLRLEMRMPLYGNDIDETTTPLEAGLKRFVKLDKGDFIGREALVKQKEAGLTRRLVGFVMEEKGIARHGYPILVNGEVVGEVTSGSMSPSREQAIGMGYVAKPHAKAGNHMEIQIRKKLSQAIITKGRFVEIKK